MTFGLTEDGFTRKLISDILEDFVAKIKAAPALGIAVDTDPDSPIGQLNGILANEAAAQWEQLEGIYHSFDPNAAMGDALTNLAAITGTAKRAAAASVVAITANLEAGTTVPAGSLISVTSRPDILFSIDADIENTGGSPANIPGTATCEQTGPIQVLAGTLEVIVNPVGGWNSVTNALDADIGRLADNNQTLRARRESELALAGGCTLDATLGDLFDVDTVEDVLLLENGLSHFDSTTGLPGHSYEALISDGGLTDNDDLAQVLWTSKPTGIKPRGNLSGNATDKNGQTQAVAFSRPEDRLIYLDLDLTVNSSFPEDGEVQVDTIILARCVQTFGISDDVVPLVVAAAAFTVAGVTNCIVRLGFAALPTNTDTLLIGLKQRAKFDSTRININFV